MDRNLQLRRVPYLRSRKAPRPAAHAETRQSPERGVPSRVPREPEGKGHRPPAGFASTSARRSSSRGGSVTASGSKGRRPPTSRTARRSMPALLRCANSDSPPRLRLPTATRKSPTSSRRSRSRRAFRSFSFLASHPSTAAIFQLATWRQMLSHPTPCRFCQARRLPILAFSLRPSTWRMSVRRRGD